MAKILLTLLLFATSAQAATLASTRLKVDTWLTNIWPTITSKQDTYLSTHGRYWQGHLAFTLANIPNFTGAQDGDAIPDNLNSRPHYQSETIADLFPTLVGNTIPAAFLCTQYLGPHGPGYCVTIFVKFNGTVYTRSRNVGFDAWRTQDWSVYTPRTPST